MLQHFTEKCMESRASKLFIKSCIWLNQQRQRMHDFSSSGFVLMLVYSLAQKFYHRLARSTYKIDFSFSNFGLGVSHSQKCYVMFQYHLTETKETELWIDLLSVAFFDHAALFSDFNHFFPLLGPGFAPYSSNAFYILEQISKNISKMLFANVMHNFPFPLSRMQSLSESPEGSNVTKPIFSANC